MRRRNLMLAAVVLGGSLLVASIAVAGGGKKNFRADELSGYQENPDVSSQATGSFRISIDDDDQTLTYELRYSGLEGTVSQAHVHFGKRGVNGGISFFLCGTAASPGPAGTPVCPQSGTVSRTIPASAILGPTAQGIEAADFEEVVAALRAGLAYANVHTLPNFGSGEIRAQINDKDQKD